MSSRKTATKEAALKSRTPKKSASTPPRRSAPKKTPESGDTPFAADDLVVFAFRLTRADRDLIHKVAGPGKATQYLRGLAVAAAKGDMASIGTIVQANRS